MTALAAGARLGPYEIVSSLGAGGMGEVYKAKDTRLDRLVAVKVLTSRLAATQELRQRFEREARAISALAHPHICTLHDVGNQDGIEYLVMEYLEGESLGQRLLRGPLPIDQVIRFSTEIADALEVAHKRGIIHRDLKPANVMLTKSGAKLLDFGLAKHAVAPLETAISAISSLPTEHPPERPLTEQGTILGTFQYMAPEQLEGRETDARTDIFAFGCLVYEMATGRRAFSGKSRASLIGSILKDHPPPISSVQTMTPPALDRLVETCLAKEPEDRFQTAHDVKLQLRWIDEGGSNAGAPAVVVARRRSRERLAWGLASVFFTAAGALGAGFVLRAPRAEKLVRFQITLPAGLVAQAPRVSPSGRLLAFSATDLAGRSQIWIRPLEALEPHPVPGTEGANLRPFWSPDSRHLAFVADGKLKKVDLTGAPAQTICDAPTGADGSWSASDVILFDGQTTDPIRRVPASGGTPQVAVASTGTMSVGWPDFLPDGRHFLYFEFGGEGDGTLKVASLDSSERKDLLAVDSLAEYVDPGFLLYVKGGTLVAQPFDAASLKLHGEQVPLAERLGANGNGLSDFSVSSDGTLVYRGGVSSDARLVWVDRNGKEVSEVDKPAAYGTTALSPDGTHLAFTLGDLRSQKADIWVRDLSRGVTSRLTFDTADHISPIWSTDGRRIVFTSGKSGTQRLLMKSVSGAEPEQEIWSSEVQIQANDWSRDGRYIAVNRLDPKTSWDIWILPADGKTKPFPFVQSSFVDLLPSFSPDGDYIAYMSNENGRFEIYVQQFPGPGGRWQVSADGGFEPHWSADGKSIYYRAAGSKIMAVPVQTKPSFSAGVPQQLFETFLQPGTRRNDFLVTRDAQRFLLLAPLGRELAEPLTVILNWSLAMKG